MGAALELGFVLSDVECHWILSQNLQRLDSSRFASYSSTMKDLSSSLSRAFVTILCGEIRGAENTKSLLTSDSVHKRIALSKFGVNKYINYEEVVSYIK